MGISSQVQNSGLETNHNILEVKNYPKLFKKQKYKENNEIAAESSKMLEPSRSNSITACKCSETLSKLSEMNKIEKKVTLKALYWMR